MTKRELLERIRATRSEVENLCRGISEEQLSELPGPKSNWAAKDLLAHLTFWENPTLDKLSGRSKAASWGDVNAINAKLLSESRSRSALEIMNEFLESGKRVILQIEALTDTELMRESPWGDGKALWMHLADDTCAHYEEHLPVLREWARRIRLL